MPRAAVNNLEIEYEVFEPADGEASNGQSILLVMGLGCQLIHWPDDFVQMLVAQGFRVVRYDNRDIGLSTQLNHLKPYKQGRFDLPRWLMGARLKSHYTIKDMASDGTALMDELCIPQAHVVGVSMGGMIGQRMAIEWPERLLSLTSIMSTSGARRVGYPGRGIMKQLTRRPSGNDTEALIDFGVKNWAMLQGSEYQSPPEELRPFIERVVKRSTSPAGFVRQLQAVMNEPDRVRALKKVSVPTLVIHGSEDPLIHVSGGESVAAAVPGSKLEVIPGWGHDIPAALNGRLTTLIGDHARAAAA